MSQIFSSVVAENRLGSSFQTFDDRTDTLRSMFEGGSSPASPVTGQPFFDSTLEKFQQWDGSAWNQVAAKNNLTATADPVVGDDSADQYSSGSLWINTTSNDVFYCVDNTLGAAVWKNLTAAGASGVVYSRTEFTSGPQTIGEASTHIDCDTTTGGFTITLYQTSSGNSSNVVYIKNSALVNDLTIAKNASDSAIEITTLYPGEWCVIQSDFGSTTWRLLDHGYPSDLVVHIRNAATLSINNNTTTEQSFPTASELVDPYSLRSGNLIVVDRPGFWSARYECAWPSDTNGYRQCQLYRNNGIKAINDGHEVIAFNFTHQVFMDYATFAKNDDIRAKVYQNSGGSLSLRNVAFGQILWVQYMGRTVT